MSCWCGSWFCGSHDITGNHIPADNPSRTAGDAFFKNSPDQAFVTPVMICPLLDDRGHRQGALAQSLDSPASKRSLDSEHLGQGSDPEFSVDRHRQGSSAFLDKSEKDQDEILSQAFPPDRSGHLANAVSRDGHIDLKQSQLFQRFAELLPTGLAILNRNVSTLTLCLLCRTILQNFLHWRH